MCVCKFVDDVISFLTSHQLTGRRQVERAHRASKQAVTWRGEATITHYSVHCTGEQFLPVTLLYGPQLANTSAFPCHIRLLC